MSVKEMEINSITTCKITDNSLPSGKFLYSDLICLKNLFNDLPDSIINFDQINHILMKTSTSDAVIFRQQHPILKKIGNIDKLTLEFKCALNKISFDNMEFIVKDICEIEHITDADVISELSIQIMEKVSCDRQFVGVYAALCSNLQQSMKCQAGQMTLISRINKNCKDAFDRYIKMGNRREGITDNDNSITREDKILLGHDETLDKTKATCIAQFIGHLYNLKIFKISSIDYCLKRLFENVFDLQYCIDIINSIITVVANVYSKENGEQFKKYINILRDLSKNDKLTKRDRMMLMNVVEQNMCAQ